MKKSQLVSIIREAIQEEKKRPGLWANINAKRKRGEKPSHGNSKAHKDAVAAGKRIKKEATSDWPETLNSRYDDEYTFKLIKTNSDRAKYAVIDKETGEQIGTQVYNSPDSLKAAAADLIKPQGGRQSSQF